MTYYFNMLFQFVFRHNSERWFFQFFEPLVNASEFLFKLGNSFLQFLQFGIHDLYLPYSWHHSTFGTFKKVRSVLNISSYVWAIDMKRVPFLVKFISLYVIISSKRRKTMLAEGVQAKILNVRAFIAADALGLAQQMRIWFGDSEKDIVHQITFLETNKGICAMVVYRGIIR